MSIYNCHKKARLFLMIYLRNVLNYFKFQPSTKSFSKEESTNNGEQLQQFISPIIPSPSDFMSNFSDQYLNSNSTKKSNFENISDNQSKSSSNSNQASSNDNHSNNQSKVIFFLL